MPYTFKNFFKDASIYSSGQILTNACAFFLIPLYTRFLTPSDYGILGYLYVFNGLLSTILMFGLYGAQTRYCYEFKDNRKEYGKFLFSINAYLIVTLLLICSGLSVWGDKLYKILPEADIPFDPYIKIIIWSVFFQIISQMIISFYLATKQFKRCVAIQFLQFFFSTGLVIIFVTIFKQGALGQIKGILFGNILFCVIFYPMYFNNFTVQFSFKNVRSALAYGTPTVFILLMQFIHQYIDRIILKMLVSLDELGIYTLGYQIGMVMSILVASVNKAWLPNFFELMNDDTQDQAYHVKKALSIWIMVFGTICLIGSIWSQELLFLLTPPKFHASGKIVPVILFSYFIVGLYYFAANPIYYYKKLKMLPFIVGTSGLLNIIFNFILIPRYGILGAAYATVISNAYLTIVIYRVGKRYFDPKYELAKILSLLAIIVVGCKFLVFEYMTILNESIKLFYICGFVLFCCLIFKSYFSPIWQHIYASYKKRA